MILCLCVCGCKVLTVYSVPVEAIIPVGREVSERDRKNKGQGRNEMRVVRDYLVKNGTAGSQKQPFGPRESAWEEPVLLFHSPILLNQCDADLFYMCLVLRAYLATITLSHGHTVCTGEVQVCEQLLPWCFTCCSAHSYQSTTMWQSDISTLVYDLSASEHSEHNRVNMD